MVKKKATLALLPFTLCFSSATVLAATTAELESRLEQQEQQIKRLENRLKGTRAAVKENRTRMADQSDRLKINGFFSGGFATNDGDDLVLTSNGIGDDYNSSSVTKFGVQMTFEVSDNISATGQLTSKGLDDYNVEATWAYLDYEVTDDFKLRLGRTRLPYYLMSEYLDVGYAYPWVRPPIELYNLPITETDGLTAFYDLAVGPVNVTFQLYGGSTSGYTKELNASFTNNNQWSFVTQADVSDFTFRVAYSTSKLQLTDLGVEGDPGYDLYYGINGAIAVGAGIAALAPALGTAPPLQSFALDNHKVEYISGAVSYDNGSLLVMGEIANLQVEDISQPAGDSGYVTVGYRFGKWMPHLTFAKTYTDSDSDEKFHTQMAYLDTLDTALAGPLAATTIPGVGLTCAEYAAINTQLRNGISGLIRQQQSYTLGLNYDLSSRVKVKGEVAFYEGFGENEVMTGFVPGGPLGVTPTYGSAPGIGLFSQTDTTNRATVGNHTAIYSFSVDAVF